MIPIGTVCIVAAAPQELKNPEHAGAVCTVVGHEPGMYPNSRHVMFNVTDLMCVRYKSGPKPMKYQDGFLKPIAPPKENTDTRTPKELETA
jgi:hypothetical protein